MNLPGIAEYTEFLPTARQTHVDPDPTTDTWDWRGYQVNVLRRTNPEAPVRVLLVHGAGGHARALWPVAAQLPAEAVDLTAVDLPLYGSTVSPDPANVTYHDWVDLLVDFVTEHDDHRPLVLLGASVGGLLACEVAARSGAVGQVVATCLLNPRDRRSRAAMTRFGPLGILGGPLARLIRGRVRRVRIPINWVAPLSKMSRDPGLARLCTRDPRGGGTTVPLGFLASYLTYRHEAAEKLAVPLTLVHPAADAWTPVELSARWLRGTATPSQVVMLRGCGHFPVEEPGLSELVQVITGITSELND